MGLHWNRNTDELQFDRFVFRCSNVMTKRMLLADIARIFDPLGLVQPLIVAAKMLMQDTWKEKLNWDDVLPLHMQQQWINISTSLSRIHEVSFPRWISYLPSSQHVYELHGFADASQRGYGCVIYLRSSGLPTQPPVIILAKSRVSPAEPVTIPRLELKGALLLATMLDKVKMSLDVPLRCHG